MKANILVIDDEDSIRFSFQRFPAAVRHNVITGEIWSPEQTEMDGRFLSSEGSRANDPSKTIVEIWPLAGECEVFGRRSSAAPRRSY